MFLSRHKGALQGDIVQTGDKMSRMSHRTHEGQVNFCNVSGSFSGLTFMSKYTVNQHGYDNSNEENRFHREI